MIDQIERDNSMSKIEALAPVQANQIFGYIARRAGGRITIDGTDAEGNPVKVTRIEAIQAAQPWPIASRDDGTEFQLVSSGAPELTLEG